MARTRTVDIIVRTSVGDVNAIVELDGKYIPARWGFDGGSPEEWPEATIVEVYADDGEPIPEGKLTAADVARIEEEAIQADQDAYDDAPEPF